MTIASPKATITANTDGVNKTFPYDFIIYSESKLELWITGADDVETEITTNFSITGIGDPAGGDFTYPVTGTAIASGSYLTLRRAEPYTQLFDPIDGQAFNAETVEAELDLIVAALQQVVADVDRCVKVGVAGIDDPDELLADIDTAVAASAASAAAAASSETNAAASEVAAEASAVRAEAAAASVTFQSDQQTADPAQTDFTMPFAISTEEDGMQIFADGVFQNRDQYTINASPLIEFTDPFVGGEVLTFLSIPFVAP